eukprot:JP446111.1.p2 GENE.JP446111.1~~JP446111.1.p2  ORF type:complete len:440 (+),score=161.48 JP446111.1:64-1320(+)
MQTRKTPKNAQSTTQKKALVSLFFLVCTAAVCTVALLSLTREDDGSPRMQSLWRRETSKGKLYRELSHKQNALSFKDQEHAMSLLQNAKEVEQKAKTERLLADAQVSKANQLARKASLAFQTYKRYENEASQHRNTASEQLKQIQDADRESMLVMKENHAQDASAAQVKQKGTQLQEKGQQDLMSAQQLAVRARLELAKSEREMHAKKRGNKIVESEKAKIKDEQSVMKQAEKMPKKEGQMVVAGANIRLSQEKKKMAIGKYMLKNEKHEKMMGKAIHHMAVQDIVAAQTLKVQAKKELHEAHSLLQSAKELQLRVQGSKSNVLEKTRLSQDAHERLQNEETQASTLSSNANESREVAARLAQEANEAKKDAMQQLSHIHGMLAEVHRLRGRAHEYNARASQLMQQSEKNLGLARVAE